MGPKRKTTSKKDSNTSGIGSGKGKIKKPEMKCMDLRSMFNAQTRKLNSSQEHDFVKTKTNTTVNACGVIDLTYSPVKCDTTTTTNNMTDNDTVLCNSSITMNKPSTNVNPADTFLKQIDNEDVKIIVIDEVEPCKNVETVRRKLFMDDLNCETDSGIHTQESVKSSLKDTEGHVTHIDSDNDGAVAGTSKSCVDTVDKIATVKRTSTSKQIDVKRLKVDLSDGSVTQTETKPNNENSKFLHHFKKYNSSVEKVKSKLPKTKSFNARSLQTTPQKNKSTWSPGKRSPFYSPFKRKWSTPGKFVKHRSFNESNSSPTQVYRVPYYLKLFRKIIREVTSDLDYSKLFNEDDKSTIRLFLNASEPAQKIYVRIFCRKVAWHPLSKLNSNAKYKDIAPDLQPSLDALTDCKLLMKDLNNLESILGLLDVQDVNNLCKTYNIKTTNQKKADLIASLMTQSRQTTIGSFFTSSQSDGGSSVMLKRAKSTLGVCYKLSHEARSVFLRILSLFSLVNTSRDDDDVSLGHTELFRILQTDIGTLKYPEYPISKISPVFQSRDDLIQFGEALQCESDILAFVENKKWEEAKCVYLGGRGELQKVDGDPDAVRWYQQLRSFLRPYTTATVLTRVLDIGVDVLQRLKQYQEAVDQLDELIQGRYCLDYRGRWYERLALNLEQHLKDHKQALRVIEAGLADENVRCGHRLALYSRAKKICTSKSKLSREMSRFNHPHIQDAIEVTVKGKLLSKTLVGTKNNFIMENGGSDGVVKCGVEELVLCHYRELGYTEGVHGEGAVVTSLFSLLFWDIIFMAVPDVFHNAYQTCPLDFYTDNFYAARKNTIESRLKEIKNSPTQSLEERTRESWGAHYGMRCRGMSWTRFRDSDHVCGLVRCLGGRSLAGILRRVARNPRQTRGGFPDLTMWNPTTLKVKFSEVKGPGDRLSQKQILWLDHLMTVGVDAEVCRVIGVGDKMLRQKDDT